MNRRELILGELKNEMRLKIYSQKAIELFNGMILLSQSPFAAQQLWSRKFSLQSSQSFIIHNWCIKAALKMRRRLVN